MILADIMEAADQARRSYLCCCGWLWNYAGLSALASVWVWLMSSLLGVVQWLMLLLMLL